jgi:hypothetical protein
VQFAQPARGRLRRGIRRQVEQHRPHLGAQEVIRARGAELGQRRVPGPGQEVQHGGGVGVVPDHPAVGRGQAADQRGQAGRAGVPLPLRQRRGDHRPERLGDPVLVDVPLRGGDDLQRARLALGAARAPRGDAVPAQDDPDRLRVVPPDLRDIQAELEAGPPPRHPRHPVAEAGLGQRLAVPGRGQRDAGVRVEVVDVRRLDQAVHGGVDGRGRAAFTP